MPSVIKESIHHTSQWRLEYHFTDLYLNFQLIYLSKCIMSL